MPIKDLNNTELGSIEKHKAETVTVKGTVTTNQRIILQKLIGIIGSNEQDVVGKILTLWLYNEGFLKYNKDKVKTKFEKEDK
jgi:hypothetical protein